MSTPADAPPLPPSSRIFTRDFNLAMVANFLSALGQQMLTAVLPLYVLSIGGNAADAGLVSGFMALVSLLVRPLTGWATDAWNRRPLVLIGTAGYSLANLIYQFSSGVPMLLVGRTAHGIGLSAYSAASSAYVADITPPRRRAEALGLYAVAQDIGLITGPAVGIFIVTAISFHGLFWFSAGLAGLAFLVSWFPRERRRPGGSGARFSLGGSLIARDALPVLLMSFCLGLGFGPHNAFLTIFAEHQGVANPGFYFTVQALGLMASRTFAGRIADRYGRAYSIVPGVIVGALALGLLPFWSDLPHFMISAALFGLGFGSSQPSIMALLVDRTGPHQRGVAVSTYLIGFDGGISLGSILFGQVSDQFGFAVMWRLAALGFALALLGVFADHHWPVRVGLGPEA